MSTQRGGSAASRVFVVVGAAAVVIGVLLGIALVAEAHRSAHNDAASVTAAVAATLAEVPAVGAALAEGGSPGSLQPLADGVRSSARVDFVTIMTPPGIRVTHPDPARIGEPYLGTIPPDPRPLTEEFEGTLGPSTRTIVPVVVDDDLVGWVSVGVTVGSIASEVLLRVPFALGVAVAVLGVGFAGAVVARRTTRRVAGDLPSDRIRDAVSAYESVRTLGEALRAQTHEHGNRLHTAVALIELGRSDEAIDILTETSRTSQNLVDVVVAYRDGDPTLGALLLGKSAQARERGVELVVDVDPAAPRGVLSAVDTVSVVGNLIDNALDAAGAADEPRWASVRVGSSADGGLVITVSDSGAGVPAELRERVFEHGFSTKPAGPEGRGVGLALARSIVEAAGGTLTIDDDPPTTLRVVLPAVARR